jgi:serine protease Do
MNRIISYVLNAPLWQLVAGVVLILALGYSFGPSRQTPPLTVASSIVSVTNADETGGGTGFSARTRSGAPVIVTNDHVCNAEHNGFVTVRDDQRVAYTKRIVARNFIRDLCLIDGIEAPQLSLARSTSLYRFQDLYVMGHPLLGPTSPSQGYYIQRSLVPIGFNAKDGACPEGAVAVDSFFGKVCVLNMDLGMTTVPVYPGNSGSPIVNADGEVVGVINSGNPGNAYGGFVPLEYLRQFLREY